MITGVPESYLKEPAMTATSTRTWDAVIEIEGVEIEASPASHDVLRETVASAAREAMLLGPEAHIVVFKTTKARGRERDRSFHAWTENGRTLYAPAGA